MTEYQFAASKPDRVLINYNTARVAELKAIYKTLVSDRQVQSIVSDMAHENEDKVRDYIGFLHAVDLLERGHDDRVVTPLNRDLFPDLAFEARLLYHLRQQQYPDDHVTRIQDVALNTGDRSVAPDILLPEVKSELDEYEFKWNETKLRMWQALSTQLGVVSETETRGVILSPCRRLLYDLLELYEQEEETTDLYSALTWVEENFFTVFETTTGSPRVHPAVSDVLQNMEAEDVLELRGMSDATDVVTLPESVHTQRSRSVNVYDRAELPDSPTYQYPLAQFNQVITQ